MCDKVKQFWLDLWQWLLSVSNVTLILEEKNILFSSQGRNRLVNFIFTTAKHYIYTTKFFANELNVTAYIAVLKDKFRCEKIYCLLK